ncbi:hypothetical protein RUM44_006037 [Polyplax serrata]|uniref:Conserved oligomeric Golgi complex subunit 5 n=1 Tax=Polyplax serrata TaxID=468196 RepID=A0ABR1AYS1_POLSC
MTVEKSVLEIMGNDDFLKHFINPVEGNVSLEKCTQILSVSEQIAKLSEGIDNLNRELQKQVSENHDDLLFHASWIEKLEDVLEMMSANMQSLLSGAERISSQIVQPYQQMEEKFLRMENILKTLNILRRITRIQVVSHRLPPHVTSDSDILKISQNIKELDKLWNEIDLSNIKILEPNEKRLKTIKNEVSERAKVQLMTGIKKQKLQHLTEAVQIFYDLNVLVVTVKGFISSSVDDMKKVIDENIGALLDSSRPKGSISGDKSKRGPGKAAMPAVGNASSFRPRLWSALDEIFDNIYTYAIEVEFLESSLHQNRSDYLSVKSHTYLEVFPENYRNITHQYWIMVNTYVEQQLNKCSKNCKFVREALEGEYPRFLRLYMDLCKKLQTSDKPENFNYKFSICKSVITPFEQSYLCNLDSVVSYPVHNMFSSDGTPKPVPTTEDIDSLIRIIRSELSVALFDSNLSSTIARNITKSIGIFCNLCEEHIVEQGSDATQVIGVRKTVQDRNIEVANRLEYLKVKLNNVTANLGKNTEAAEILNLSLVTYADSLITKIITTMLDSVKQAIKKIILTMHVEDFSSQGEKPNSISLYMKELTAFVSRAFNTYLKPFDSQDVLKKCCVEYGMNCVEFFLRNISVVRPLGAGGRMRLTADCNEFEFAMSPLLGEEPKSYRMLRLFKLMLTQSPQEILNNPAVGDTVPYSLILFYLFSFAPDEMKSPHESGVDPKIKSMDTLLDYLDSHQSEWERIDLINRVMAKYCESVRQVPGKNFDPVYGVMAHLIQRFRSVK